MQLSKEFCGKDFLSLHDFSSDEITYFLDVADFLKKTKKAGGKMDYLAGKTLGMIFQKSSTRTRVSFETGIYYLGGMGLFLSSSDLQMGRGEPIKDTARVLSRYLDGIMIRTFDHNDVIELAEYADIPVINGLTDLLHPCQCLADMQAAREFLGDLKGKKLVFIGDGNNVAHSLMYGGAKLGMHVTVVCPEGYEPDATVLKNATADADACGGSITIARKPLEAIDGAHVVYTDVWASMGQEKEASERQKAFAGYCVDSALMAKAAPNAIVMHCLPAHRGEEITDEIMETYKDSIIGEAENRLYAQMAIMALTMQNK